jgi:hypothetical protein|tara:strand:+ start:2840 stop:3004 length:165 start_codon:yes stop_codon:yes gene_type:complete
MTVGGTTRIIPSPVVLPRKEGRVKVGALALTKSLDNRQLVAEWIPAFAEMTRGE